LLDAVNVLQVLNAGVAPTQDKLGANLRKKSQSADQASLT